MTAFFDIGDFFSSLLKIPFLQFYGEYLPFG
jgi:hypothetical protein